MAQKHVLTAVLTPDLDGGYVAQVAELPGAISQGETVEEALVNVREAAELYLEDATAEELAALDAHPVTAAVQVSVG
ncbi:type II toxin-antitoxin system HicB family antitoxin [Natronosporangium hydrolyticum]|jgi:predicted RNase H-like HicB family nuclease|uniref:Type II toxin-antitoxin system HicB family antitoxin n=1 Tax=Natronosporangium hydrolyticum TaxID=2811111 RepID=A0A895YBM8_9ACTN|nr:type II toxin-antitoxin system HicB family antitoxin [Natronosporangium hydrolyticum]QSB14841.1 type II toxin-antitoxin system HicB family antitoxin [Natronosporangium hydrolyticum]